jgi:osmotically inducible protein OsmC
MKIVEFERSAEILWEGDVVKGSGHVTSGTRSFVIPATFPSLRGEPTGVTTPEELLAAAHATCFGIGLRSVIARRGGTASRIVVRATITAKKGEGGIRLIRSALSGIAHDLRGIESADLLECARIAKDECTISNALKGNVEIVCDVTSP